MGHSFLKEILNQSKALSFQSFDDLCITQIFTCLFKIAHANKIYQQSVFKNLLAK